MRDVRIEGFHLPVGAFQAVEYGVEGVDQAAQFLVDIAVRQAQRQRTGRDLGGFDRQAFDRCQVVPGGQGAEPDGQQHAQDANDDDCIPVGRQQLVARTNVERDANLDGGQGSCVVDPCIHRVHRHTVRAHDPQVAVRIHPFRHLRGWSSVGDGAIGRLQPDTELLVAEQQVVQMVPQIGHVARRSCFLDKVPNDRDLAAQFCMARLHEFLRQGPMQQDASGCEDEDGDDAQRHRQPQRDRPRHPPHRMSPAVASRRSRT